MPIQDGSVTWQKDFIMGLRKLPLVVGYNKKQTFTSSGTFTPTMTGLYKITLQGGGGGGSGAGITGYGQSSGSGGGSGAKLEFYEKLNAGQSYDFTIGAGGAGGAAGSSSTPGANGTAGGNTTITLNSKNYIAGGGVNGFASGLATWSGYGGVGIVDNTIVTAGFNGETGNTASKLNNWGGKGGGAVGEYNNSLYLFGGGGNGGTYDVGSGSIRAGNNGGDGYITFEWFDPSEAFPDIWAELEPSE